MAIIARVRNPGDKGKQDNGRTVGASQKIMKITRRAFIAGSAAPFLLPAQKRPQLAAVVTEIRKFSHGQHIVDRFLEGYGWNGTHHHPAMDLVALYVDQHPSGDLTPDRAARFSAMKVYPTIGEALTRGTSKLA